MEWKLRCNRCENHPYINWENRPYRARYVHENLYKWEQEVIQASRFINKRCDSCGGCRDVGEEIVLRVGNLLWKLGVRFDVKNDG